MVKREKNNGRLLILLVVLSITAVLYYSLTGEKTDSLNTDRDKFAMENTINIDRVGIKGKGNDFQLVFRGGKWRVNDDYPADPVRIHVFFATVQKLSIRRPVSRELYDDVLDKMEKEGRKISLFSGEREMMRYRVWGDTSGSSTYVMDGNNGDIYLVEIPGYRTYIYGLFALSENEWKDPRIFTKMNWRNLSAIEILYPNAPEDGFEIVRGEEFYKIKEINKTDTAKLVDYIDNLSLISRDDIVSGIDPKDEKIMEIRVRDVSGKTYTARFFRNPENRLLKGKVDEDIVFSIRKEKFATLNRKADHFIYTE